MEIKEWVVCVLFCFIFRWGANYVTCKYKTLAVQSMFEELEIEVENVLCTKNEAEFSSACEHNGWIQFVRCTQDTWLISIDIKYCFGIYYLLADWWNIDLCIMLMWKFNIRCLINLTYFYVLLRIYIWPKCLGNCCTHTSVPISPIGFMCGTYTTHERTIYWATITDQRSKGQGHISGSFSNFGLWWLRGMKKLDP